MNVPILTVENVSVSYGSVVALEDVSFEVDEGEFFCVVGANGSGKSTLIRGILGLTPLTRGVAGFAVERERVSYVPQFETADRDFPATVREIVLTGTQKRGWRIPFYTKEDRRAAEEALSFFGIEALGSSQIGKLSGGQRQRAMLARAMCRKPALLFLDEPCAGLDADAKKSFYALLSEWNRRRKVTVVMVSHDLGDVEARADRIAVLDRKLIFLGTPEAVGPVDAGGFPNRKATLLPVSKERENTRRHTMYTFTNQFISDDKNLEFLKAAMMGPNALRVTEELASYLNINENMRILDLGCGCGLSTLLLAKKFGVSVFAADLWISPTENYERFQSLGIEDKAVPIFVDATQGLPFAKGYFDLLLTVDAYHYFGDTAEMLPSLIPFVKKGGYIAVAIPGLKYEFGENIPDEMQPFWNSEMKRTLHSLDWWKDLWKRAEGIEMADSREMACCGQAWKEWQTGYHPVVAEDIKMMEAEGGKYFNIIQLIAQVS